MGEDDELQAAGLVVGVLRRAGKQGRRALVPPGDRRDRTDRSGRQQTLLCDAALESGEVRLSADVVAEMDPGPPQPLEVLPGRRALELHEGMHGAGRGKGIRRDTGSGHESTGLELHLEPLRARGCEEDASSSQERHYRRHPDQCLSAASK